MEQFKQKESEIRFENIGIQVSIDKSWITCAAMRQIYSLLTCPICLKIPIESQIECSKCESIFCLKDYIKIVKSENQLDKKCPKCKSFPWISKKKMHLGYKNLFDEMRLKCKICQVKSNVLTKQQNLKIEEFSIKQLIFHIEKEHNTDFALKQTLYDYCFISSTGKQIKLTKMQNLQMNLRRVSGLECFTIKGRKGNTYNVNLKTMTAEHITVDNFRITSQRTQTLQKNKQYIIWVFHYQIVHTKNNVKFFVSSKNQSRRFFFDQREMHELSFFSEIFQNSLEKHYKQYIKNKNNNIMQTRSSNDENVIVNFSNFTMTNTTRKYSRLISRAAYYFIDHE